MTFWNLLQCYFLDCCLVGGIFSSSYILKNNNLIYLQIYRKRKAHQFYMVLIVVFTNNYES